MNIGMIMLAIWLILGALGSFGVYAVPPPLMGAIAVVAAILILVGR